LDVEYVLYPESVEEDGREDQDEHPNIVKYLDSDSVDGPD